MSKETSAPRRVMIADPHGLGDSIMTIPLAGVIRRGWPRATIHYAGSPEMKPLFDACEFIDRFIDSKSIVEQPQLLKQMGIDVILNPFPDDALARAAHAARVPVRVGNLLRRTAVYFNRFVAYNSTLKGHILGFRLRHLKPLGLATTLPQGDHIKLYGLTRTEALAQSVRELLDPGRFNLILHPKSGGSGREWPPGHYLDLARSLGKETGFKLFITGSQRERAALVAECPALLTEAGATDLMGQLSLSQFLALVRAADGVLASGTGPLHAAAALGRHALGLYPAGLGLDPVAWAPIGPGARTLRGPGSCKPGVGSCPKAKGPPCHCITQIGPELVREKLVMPAALAWGAELVKEAKQKNGGSRTAALAAPGF
jgi:heptosyltransferase-3